MSLDEDRLETAIKTELENNGVTITDEVEFRKLAGAIAKAVVDEITGNAQVVIPGGSSAGTYGVQ